MSTALATTARHFHDLHDPAAPLALPNAWDAASAVVIAAAGARAIATTSAGVAWSLGAPDGDRLGLDRALAAATRVVGAVDVPVTVDIESGYAPDAEGVATTIRGVLDAGAVGVNIEDGDRDPADLAARIAVARRTADDAGVALFVNARTDVFLRGLVPPADQVADVVARAERYVAAGADGLFVPGATDPATIAEISARVTVPVNVMAGPGLPAVAELGRLGVARVSLGSSVAQAAYEVARRATEELLATGTYETSADALDYGTLNDLVAHADARRDESPLVPAR